MAEPTTQPSPVSGLEQPVYRPLSGLAIGSFVCALAFMLIVVVGGTVSWFGGAPFFLDLWLLIFPFAGALLAVAAWRQIRLAEGTRAGMALAGAGLWMSILFGCGYGAYYLATELALRQQARNFTQEWLQLIRQGEIARAFIQTLEPARRKGVPAKLELLKQRFSAGPMRGMGPSGPLKEFQLHRVVQLLEQGGADAVLQPAGIRNWEYKGGGYQVRQLYRLESLEGVFEFLISVRGSESPRKEFEGRQWHVILNETGVRTETLSAAGKKLRDMQSSSRDFIRRWLEDLNKARMDHAYLATREPSERERLQALQRAIPALLSGLTAAAASSGNGLGELLALSGPLADHDLARVRYLPDYAGFVAGQLVNDQSFEGKEELRKSLVVAIRNHFHADLKKRPGSDMGFFIQEPQPWKLDVQERLHLSYLGRIGIMARDLSQPVAAGMASFLVESGPHDIRSAKHPSWRVVRIDLTGPMDMGMSMESMMMSEPAP